MFDIHDKSSSYCVPQHFALEHLESTPRYSVAPALDSELDEAIAFTTDHLPGLRAGKDIIASVHHATRTILCVRATRTGKIAGTFAALPLNNSGFQRLISGDFDFARPDLADLAMNSEAATAIYGWSLCLPGRAVVAVGNIMRWLAQSAYAHADIFAWPGTIAGQRFQRRTGFEFFCSLPDSREIWVYRRKRQ